MGDGPEEKQDDIKVTVTTTEESDTPAEDVETAAAEATEETKQEFAALEDDVASGAADPNKVEEESDKMTRDIKILSDKFPSLSENFLKIFFTIIAALKELQGAVGEGATTNLYASNNTSSNTGGNVDTSQYLNYESPKDRPSALNSTFMETMYTKKGINNKHLIPPKDVLARRSPRALTFLLEIERKHNQHYVDQKGRDGDAWKKAERTYTEQLYRDVEALQQMLAADIPAAELERLRREETERRMAFCEKISRELNIDLAILMGMLKMESSFKALSKNDESSATGSGQFLSRTFAGDDGNGGAIKDIRNSITSGLVSPEIKAYLPKEKLTLASRLDFYTCTLATALDMQKRYKKHNLFGKDLWYIARALYLYHHDGPGGGNNQFALMKAYGALLFPGNPDQILEQPTSEKILTRAVANPAEFEELAKKHIKDSGQYGRLQRYIREEDGLKPGLKKFLIWWTHCKSVSDDAIDYDIQMTTQSSSTMV